MPALEQRPIVIHAGFHKTGTTTVQRILQDSRTALAAQMQILLKTDMPDLCRAANAYARAPSDVSLAVLRNQARDSLARLDPADPRALVISAEDLAGLIPGRGRRRGYPFAATILGEIIAAIRPYGAPQLYLSTRAQDAWLKSCYAHHLRHTRLQATQAAYLQDQACAPDLATVASQIAAALPDIPVTRQAIEDLSHLPQGPLTPIFDLLDLPASSRCVIRPHRRSNPSLPPDILARFLVLNMTEPDTTERNTAKQALIAAHRGAKT